MRHVISQIEERPRHVWPRNLAAVAALIVSFFLAVPVSAHTHATSHSIPQLSAADIITRTHVSDACKDARPASVIRATSTMPVLTASHQRDDGCDGCAHHCKCCASSSCGGGHSYALISGLSPGSSVTTRGFAAPLIVDAPEGLVPTPQLKPPRA